MYRSIHDLPEHHRARAAIRLAEARRNSRPLPEGDGDEDLASPPKPRKNHGKKPGLWPAHADRVRASLLPRTETLRIFLPGLALVSENAAERGTTGKRGKPRTCAIVVRNNAKIACRDALMRYRGELWRFERRVDIAVIQHGPEQRIDPGNLYHKPLIDCLTAAKGLGVLRDDAPRYVRTVAHGYPAEPSDRDGVEIIIALAV